MLFAHFNSSVSCFSGDSIFTLLLARLFALRVAGIVVIVVSVAWLSTYPLNFTFFKSKFAWTSLPPHIGHLYHTLDIFTTHWKILPHIGHLYHTFDLIRTILLHTRQIYYTFTLIHTILLLKSTQIHSNPLKPPFYYSFDLIRTILLHTHWTSLPHIITINFILLD